MSKKHHHQGPLPHGAHRIGGRGKDKHASGEHHAANAKHDMHEGTSPRETGDVGEGGMEHGGEGMGGNCSYEDS